MLGLCNLDGLPMRLAHGQYELTAFFHLGVWILSFYLRSSQAENDLVDEGGRCLFLLFTNSFRLPSSNIILKMDCNLFIGRPARELLESGPEIP